MITVKVDFLELTAAVYQNLKDGTGTGCINVAISETQVLQALAYSEALGESDHALAAELVVIEFENLNIGLCLGV